jgi:hypothetical protein
MHKKHPWKMKRMPNATRKEASKAIHKTNKPMKKPWQPIKSKPSHLKIK